MYSKDKSATVSFFSFHTNTHQVTKREREKKINNLLIFISHRLEVF